MIKNNLKFSIAIVSILVILIVVLWQTEIFVGQSESEKSLTSNDSSSLDKKMNIMDSLYEIKDITLLKRELTKFREEEDLWSKNISNTEYAQVYEWFYHMYDNLEDVDKAAEFAKASLKLIDSTSQKYFYANMLNKNGISQSQLENYNQATNFYFRGLTVLGKDTLNKTYNELTSDLATNYREARDLDLALKYYHKSNAVAKAIREIDSIENIDESFGYYYGNLGYVYTLQGKIKEANQQYFKAIEYFENHNLGYQKSIAKSILASNYIELGELDKAEELLKGILEVALKNSHIELYVETSISLFKLNIKKGKTEQAFKIINNAEKNIGTSNPSRLLLKILDVKVRYFKDNGQFQQAFSLLENKIKLQDSINDATKTEMQRELSVKYQTDLKNEQINNLELINAKEKRIKQFYLFGLIFLLLVLGIIFFLLRRIAYQKKQVDHANSTKDQLFSIIAHDLRSPILALQGMSDLIQYHIKNNNQDKLKQLGNESQLALSKINQLLKNLLDWSLTNTNQLSLKPEKVNIIHLIDESIHLFDNMLHSKQIEVKRFIEEKTLILDKNMMGSAIRNILSNAIKLSPENSPLIITGKTTESSYQLSIEDEAGGMPDEILKSIQQNNHQLIQGKSNESVGLGMRLIQLFIDKNKAQLHIENTQKGTKVSIMLHNNPIKPQ